MGRYACLTLDFEDDWTIPDAPDRNPTLEHLDDFVAIVDDLDVPISVFAVGRAIERHPDHVDRIDDALDAEFHLHSYRHDITGSSPFDRAVRDGIDAYESHFGRRPIGSRAPQGDIRADELAHLEATGFEFDASVFPSYRPGVYNNLTAPLRPYFPAGCETLLEIPFGAVPGLRIPIAVNYLKLLGRPYARLLRHVPLSDVVVIDSHLQDFWYTEFHDHLSEPKRTLMTRNMDRATDLFREFVTFLDGAGYEFVAVSDINEAAR